MEVFVILVLIGVFAAIAISRNNKKVNDAWADAASKLRLIYSDSSGTRIFKGQHGEIALEVRTETVGKATWTSYKAEFPESLPFPVRLQPQTFLSRFGNTVLNRIDLETGDDSFDSKIIVESSRPEEIREFLDERARNTVRRLLARFDEFEMNNQQVTVKHSRLISSESELVDNVRLLVNATRDLWASAIPEVVEKPMPPPLPSKKVEPEALNEPDPEPTPAVVPLPEPVIIGESRNQGHSPEIDEKQVDLKPEPEIPVAIPPVDHTDSTFSHHCRSIFAECQGRYAMSKQFEIELEGNEIDDLLTLVETKPYSMDRNFGRGPGILRFFSLGRLPDGNELRLVADSEEDAILSELESRKGNSEAVVGELFSFDPFSHTLFLRTQKSEHAALATHDSISAD